MGKNPAFQFYPGDWFREPGLRSACIVVRGCWAEALFVMHDTTPRGLLKYSVLEYSRLWRIHPQVACYVIWQLDRLGIADVEYQSKETDKEIERIAIDCEYSGIVNEEPKEPGSYIGTPEGAVEYCTNQRHYSSLFVQIKSRRMYNEWLSKENERLRGEERRKIEAIQKKSRKNPPPSSSSSSKKETKAKKEKPPASLFTLPPWMPPELWKVFLSHRRKKKAPVPEEAYPRFIAKFDKLRSKGWDPERVVDTIIERGWQWFNPEWIKDTSSGPRKDDPVDNPLSRQKASDIISRWQKED